MNEIKILRKEYSLKQWELASRIGISQCYLCQIETGKKTPTILVLKKIASYFDRDLIIQFKSKATPVANYKEDYENYIKKIKELYK